MTNHFNESQLSDADSIQLLGQTESNSYGDYVRIFHFVTTNYAATWQSDSLLENWESAGGQLQTDGNNKTRFTPTCNESGQFSLSEETIGRIQVDRGFLILSLDAHQASVESIDVVNENGETVSWGEPVGKNMYISTLLSGFVQDIVVEVSGQSDGYVVFNGAEIWQETG